MKLGESINRRSFLEERLDALQSRLTRDCEQGQPETHLIEEMLVITEELSILDDSISFTKNQVCVSGKSIAGYEHREKRFSKLAYLIENANVGGNVHARERVDGLRSAANSDFVLAQIVNWTVDLQSPDISKSENTKKED